MPDALFSRIQTVADALEADRRPATAEMMRDLGGRLLASITLIERARDLMARTEPNLPTDDEWHAFLIDAEIWLNTVRA